MGESLRKQSKEENMCVQLLDAPVIIVVQIIDDLLGEIFGVACHILPSQRRSPRPRRATLSHRKGKDIVRDVLQKHGVTKKVDVEDMQQLILVHARKVQEARTEIEAPHHIIEECLSVAEKTMVENADKGTFHVDVPKYRKKYSKLADQARDRLYQPSDPPARPKRMDKTGFGRSIRPLTAESIIKGEKPKPKFRFGQSVISKLHARHIPPARVLISAIDDIIDFIVSGEARSSIEKTYGIAEGSDL